MGHELEDRGEGDGGIDLPLDCSSTTYAESEHNIVKQRGWTVTQHWKTTCGASGCSRIITSQDLNRNLRKK